ncbi:MAG: cyclodeaminase/cyclohydrolase family protein [Candidatus Omnitrophica bacterium]|nr:cyclodeaminase/cyclohydrolase family protein [Candidatus Omnitrophota bacterium]
MDPIPDSAWAVRRFLSALSSSRAAPGGGSAAALCGAMGCSLGSMVCRILVRRRNLSTASRRRLQGECRALDRLSGKMSRLIREDSKVYGELLRSTRTKRGLPRARQRAIEVPLQICEAAAEAASRVSRLERVSGVSLRSDLRAAGALLKGSFEAARAMVEINL